MDDRIQPNSNNPADACGNTHRRRKNVAVAGSDGLEPPPHPTGMTMRCPRPENLLEGLVPACVLPFAVWTAYVHLMTATHASFITLMQWLPLAALVAAATTLAWFRWPDATPPRVDASPARDDGRGRHTAGFTGNRRVAARPIAVLALAALWTDLLLAGMPYPVFWWVALLAMCLVWTGHLRGMRHGAPACAPGQHDPWKMATWIVGLVVVAAIALTLVASRPDPDDAFHLSIPATLLRFPQDPVLLHDTLYRLPGAPILTPFYRLNSYDVLIGVLARLADADLHAIAYLLLPPLSAAFCITAWVYLLRRIVPTRWSSVLLLLFLVMLALGETHHAYGNFTFVRLFQGKAILATGMVPVIAGAALSFARNGGMRRWILLFAAQVVAVGLAATALFVAPATAALGLAGGWSANARSSRRFVLGMLASAYVFGAAKAMLTATHGGQGFVSSNPMPPVLLILEQTWGWWSTGILLIALLCAWAFVRNPVRARYLSAGAFFFLLAVLNPYTTRFVADHFVGVYTYWRLTWALPLPLFLALALEGVVRRVLRIRPRVLAAAMCTILAGAAVTFGWWCGTLRSGNSVTLGVPRLKVYAIEYPVAKRVADIIPESGAVLTPELVSFWLPTFVVHPQLLGTRLMYLRHSFSSSEALRRRDLMEYVAGTDRSSVSTMLLADALQRYGLTAVVLKHSAPWRGEMESVLEHHAWQPLACGTYYDTWVRAGSVAVATQRARCGSLPHADPSE